ncbi:MAG: HD domain-containing protein [Holophaga sp.]|nr:HD domain-containing protein [Holophaga sp.]
MDPALQRILQVLGPDAQLAVVGGVVRDRLLGRAGGDWDLATALLPGVVLERAQAAGLRAIPTGLQHGTVTLMEAGQAFELTTFRGDGAYLDGRRPESVVLGLTLEQDLARRDFTINAMALPAEALEREDWQAFLVDPFGGRRDLEARLIRAVGDPLLRFREDGLRCLRACRFQAQLGFAIEPGTLAAIPPCLGVAAKVAVERAMVELTKLLCGPEPERGLTSLAGTGLLDLWLPELRPMVGCVQNRHHRYPVWEHVLEVIRQAPPEPDLRWAALLHDAGKPAARTVDPRGETHFYGHEAISVTMAGAILTRLRASHALIRQVTALVRHHGTHPGPEWGDAACRRFLKQLREDDLPLERWASFRIADQSGKGFGVQPYQAEHAALVARLQALAAQRPPLAIQALALDGRALMALAERKGGPWLGQLQQVLMEAVLEDPARNQPGPLRELAGGWLDGHPD